MSERKVLNKYYPPDYDPSKIPKLPKGAKSRQWVQRVMAPFNMRCNTCGEYIARAKKFNMRREKVVGEDYLGLMIFRFYLRVREEFGAFLLYMSPSGWPGWPTK